MTRISANGKELTLKTMKTMSKPLSFFLPIIPPTVTVDWAVVSGFGDKYLIRRDGTVMNRKTGKILKHILKSDGYLAVHLSYENKAKMVMVHRLVAEAFLPNPKNLPVVNHIDGNKTNPNVENLEWVTFSENSKHAYRIGLSNISEKCKQAVSKIAAQNGAKTTSIRVVQIDNSKGIIHEYRSIREAERITGIPRSNIARACKSEKYSAGGYTWKKI